MTKSFRAIRIIWTLGLSFNRLTVSPAKCKGNAKLSFLLLATSGDLGLGGTPDLVASALDFLLGLAGSLGLLEELILK